MGKITFLATVLLYDNELNFETKELYYRNHFKNLRCFLLYNWWMSHSNACCMYKCSTRVSIRPSGILVSVMVSMLKWEPTKWLNKEVRGNLISILEANYGGTFLMLLLWHTHAPSFAPQSKNAVSTKLI